MLRKRGPECSFAWGHGFLFLFHDIMPQEVNILLVVRAVSRRKSPIVGFQLPLSSPHACKNAWSLPHFKAPTSFQRSCPLRQRKVTHAVSNDQKAGEHVFYCLVGGTTISCAPLLSWCACWCWCFTSQASSTVASASLAVQVTSVHGVHQSTLQTNSLNLKNKKTRFRVCVSLKT